MFQRYYLGPLSMALTIAIIYVTNRHAPAWVTPSLVLAVIPMTISQYFGGLRASLVCAAMVSIYALWSSDFDLSRSIQIAVSFTVAAWLGGLLKQRERHLENVARAMFANGNTEKIRQAHKLATDLRTNYLELDSDEADEYLMHIIDRIGNTLAIIDGYRFIREEIERVQKLSSDTEIAAKIREVLEAEK